ncbi:DUF559 domain-containing protein [Novosphingobium sp. BL-52-GroH]|uniref:DUF559 domain-containing protein n=1 Tax=Novosphingobium sp. BL-52-GroH TaxID=3349877 RepID=UPI00384FA866
MELDGVVEREGGHDAQACDYDTRGTRFLNEQGYAVIRFWNAEVLDSTESILARIQAVLADMPSPGPSRRWKGSPWNPATSRGRDV